ncbi:hypothetical protein CHUAL_008702 [Chamberlinius hualienensis]
MDLRHNFQSSMKFLRIIQLFIATVHLCTAVEYKVSCFPKSMVATIYLPNAQSAAYLDRLKGYPACQPKLGEDRHQAVFQLSLEDIYSCGTTRVFDRITGRRIYYHQVMIETEGKPLEAVLIKCDFSPLSNKSTTFSSSDIAETSGRLKRNVLPANFTEAVELEKIGSVVVEVPAPMIHVSVKQNGLNVDTQINVVPGTPLQMDIYLDKNSTDTYGLFVKEVKVTDNSPNQEEVILENGCSVDPYLFTNFETADGGDNLSAKFRAFKFPDSSYVMFIGTVNVCLQNCRGVQCNNGQTGYGRKRRALLPNLNDYNKDPNKIFEVTMTTIMMVDGAKQNGPKQIMTGGPQTVQSRDYESSAIRGAKFESDKVIIINNGNHERNTASSYINSSLFAIISSILLCFFVINH